jgi:hypothetical protein
VRLDRELQRQVLERLRDAYPNSVDLATLACASHPDFQSNLHYLHEHRLIEGTRLADRGPAFVMGRVTAAGLDFLQGDGGPAAILGRREAGRKTKGRHGSDT